MKKNQGFALVGVMLVLLIASLVAVAMLTRQQLDIRRTANMVARAQAQQYALGAITLARQVIYATRQAEPDVVYGGQPWATLNSGFAIENGKIELHIEDMQGKFNLKSLTSGSETPKQLERLLSAIGINEVDAKRVRALGWVYDLSEFRAIGVGAETIDRLQQYIVTLPDVKTALNVNTASDTLLAIYIPDDAQRQKLLNARKGGFIRPRDLISIGVPAGNMATDSNYFRVSTTVHYAGRIAQASAVMQYKKTVNAMDINTILFILDAP